MSDGIVLLGIFGAFCLINGLIFGAFMLVMYAIGAKFPADDEET